MKNFLIIWMLLINITVFAQFPILDHFTSIGGANKWYKAFGGPSMGIDGGTNLCYNVGTNYSNNTNYSFQSPNYTNRFLSCTNITITLSATMNIRGNDNLYFFYINGGVWSLGIPIVNGTNTFVLPNTVSDFSIDLYTGNSGSLNSRFVHIDWFNIACNSSLPIELLYFNGEQKSCNQNLLSWATATESNNEYFQVEKSLNGVDFIVLEKIPGAGTYLQTKQYKYIDAKPEPGINYYKLKQVDYDGSYTYSNIIDINNDCVKSLKVSKVTNLLGQDVNEDFKGPRFIFYNDGSVIKKVGE